MIIYHRRNKMVLPMTAQTIAGAERVYSMRVLGVTINQHLTTSDHLNSQVHSPYTCMPYPIGLQPRQLQLVAKMTTIDIFILGNQ